MFSDDRNDIDVTVNIDFIEKLVGIALPIMMFQDLNEMAAFDQCNDLLEADSSLADEPGVLVRIESIVPFLHMENAMTMCACCQH